MRLATRMKLTYGMVFLVPILLIILSFWGIGRIELRALRQKYDMEEASVEMLFNPFEILGNISVSVVNELATVAEDSPERLEDVSYLETMDKRLEKYSSFLVLRREGKIYYSGQDGEISENIEGRLESPWTDSCNFRGTFRIICGSLTFSFLTAAKDLFRFSRRWKRPLNRWNGWF